MGLPRGRTARDAFGLRLDMAWNEDDWPVQPGDNWTRVDFLRQLYDALWERRRFPIIMSNETQRQAGYVPQNPATANGIFNNRFDDSFGAIDPQNIRTVGFGIFSRPAENRATLSIGTLLQNIGTIGRDYTTFAEADRFMREENVRAHDRIFPVPDNQAPLKTATQLALENAGFDISARPIALNPLFLASPRLVDNDNPAIGTIARVPARPARVQEWTGTRWEERPEGVRSPRPVPTVASNEANPYGLPEVDGFAFSYVGSQDFYPTAAHLNLARDILDNCEAMIGRNQINRTFSQLPVGVSMYSNRPFQRRRRNRDIQPSGEITLDVNELTDSGSSTIGTSSLTYSLEGVDRREEGGPLSMQLLTFFGTPFWPRDDVFPFPPEVKEKFYVHEYLVPNSTDRSAGNPDFTGPTSLTEYGPAASGVIDYGVDDRPFPDPNDFVVLAGQTQPSFLELNNTTVGSVLLPGEWFEYRRAT